MTPEETTKLIDGIAAQVTALAARVDAATAAEAKSLDDAMKAIQADLAEAAKAPAAEFKAWSANAGQLSARLDGIERQLNELGKDSAGKRPVAAKPKTFAECKSLDAAMRNGGDVLAEVKALDPALKVQDVLIDSTIARDFPLLAAVDTRPTNADSPSFGFPSDAGVEVKGRYGSTQTEQTWLKSTAAVETYHYQPTLLMEDVADAGAWLLDDAAAAAVDGTRGQLDADVVAKIEGAIGDNEAMPYTAVEAIETDGASVAEIDLLAAITALAVKFRRGSVWVAAAAMTALVRGLTEAETGRRLWVDNIAVGTPPTLYGYPYIEDENVTAGNLLFGNPKRGSGVAVRQNPTLTGMERRAGDYLPCFDGRFGVCVKDARSWKVIQNAGT